MTGTVERRAGIVDVDAFERGGEAVGVAFAPLLAVGDDVEAGALLVADGDERGVVLRLLEKFRRDPPQFLGAHARRKAAGQLLAVDQPVRLRVGAHKRGRQEFARHLLNPRLLCRHPSARDKLRRSVQYSQYFERNPSMDALTVLPAGRPEVASTSFIGAGRRQTAHHREDVRRQQFD